MADSSFDVVSTVDRQEVDNAINQCGKELRQRYDFKNTGAEVEWQGEWGIVLRANTEERVVAALDVLQSKIIKRGISLKALESGDPRASGKEYLIESTLQSGMTSEQAKKVAKHIRDNAPKGVKAQVQGEEVRVSSKKRDDLQATIASLKEADFDFALQFTNYR